MNEKGALASKASVDLGKGFRLSEMCVFECVFIFIYDMTIPMHIYTKTERQREQSMT